MWENIPQELKRLPQWVAVGPDREPLNPVTLGFASVSMPNTWGTFLEACSTGSYIGFVITANDPYCMIDIDDKLSDPATPEEKERQVKILEAFQSYTERSVSKRGYHIIIKATIPTGTRRNHVEIYSSVRYMIMTGDVVRDLPIADYSDLANKLHHEMHGQYNRDIELASYAA